MFNLYHFQFVDGRERLLKNLKLEYDSKSEWLQEYNIKVSRIGNKKNETETVGMTFHLQRYSKPFIGKYYIPCIVLIILTSVSFFVPPKLVPGRGGMLVTLFLVLSNTSSASKVLQQKCTVNIFLFPKWNFKSLFQKETPISKSSTAMTSYILGCQAFAFIAMVYYGIILFIQNVIRRNYQID